MSTASVDTLAKLLDMTPRRVQQLANEGVIPKPQNRGQYEVIPSVVGYIKHLKGMLNGDSGDLLSEKTRLTKAQANKTEIETAKLEGQLISLAEAEMGWASMVGAFRAKLISLPPRAASVVAGIDEERAEKMLTSMISEALHELSAWQPNDAANTDSGSSSGSESSGPAAESDGESVG